MKTNNWKVWLGYRASSWSHRGYTVLGETVYTRSRRDAVRIVRESLGRRVYRACADGDGALYYVSLAALCRDQTGALADAVVSRVSASEDSSED